MTLILDAGPLVALADLEDPRRERIVEAIDASAGSLIVPAPVTSEVDFLLGRRFGSAARRAFLSDLAARRFDAEALEPGEYETVRGLDGRYSDLELGLADCSIVVLAARFETRRILSFDERHFRVVAPLQGGSFELLPTDL